VRVAQARGAANETVYDRLSGGGRKDPQFGQLGGGSDHVAFNCHIGVASASFGSGGSEGNSYHSNYDTIAWYRSVVGEDYAPALMVTRMTNAIAAILADSPVVPLSAARHGVDGQRFLRAIKERASAPEIALAIDQLIERAGRSAESGAQLDAALASAHPWIGSAAVNRSQSARDACAAIDRALISLDRAWLDDGGLEGRPWFRSMLVASDKDSGYAATMLPLLAEAVEAGDAQRVRAAVVRYQAVFDRIDRGIEQARTAMQAVSSGDGPPAPLGTR
jgi:N-acetylated-alpha-linked acidic dipeptidase